MLTGLIFYMASRFNSSVPEALSDISIHSPRVIQTYKLIDHKKEELTQDRFTGHWSFVFFGFTSCPDVCPATLMQLAQLHKAIAKDQQLNIKPMFFFVSVDPARDTPERLKQYTEFFHPKILGVTGTLDELAKVAGQYGVAYRKVEQQSELGYAVDHSANVYLINRRGELVEILPHGTAPEELLARLRKLLAEAG